MENVRSILEDGIAAGHHAGAVAVAWRGGAAVLEVACGTRNDGAALQVDDVLLWMSSCKPVGAVAALQLVERGMLDLDRPIADYLPEFGRNGKEQLTARHLLTHTAGFRWVDTRGVEFDHRAIFERICDAPLEASWVPGETAGYHPFTSWFVLGALIEQITGCTFASYVREEIFLPLRMADCWIGMPAVQQQQYGARLVASHETHRPAHPLHPYSTCEGVAAFVPGGNGHGPVLQLLRFYEMLRRGGELDGARILAESTVAEMTRRHRAGQFDLTFRHVIDFGLGVIVNSSRYGGSLVPYGYGDAASENTFGHGGAQSSVAFCDPQRELVAAVVFTGMPGEVVHQRRARRVLNTMHAEIA